MAARLRSTSSAMAAGGTAFATTERASTNAVTALAQEGGSGGRCIRRPAAAVRGACVGTPSTSPSPLNGGRTPRRGGKTGLPRSPASRIRREATRGRAARPPRPRSVLLPTAPRSTGSPGALGQQRRTRAPGPQNSAPHDSGCCPRWVRPAQRVSRCSTTSPSPMWTMDRPRRQPPPDVRRPNPWRATSGRAPRISLQPIAMWRSVFRHRPARFPGFRSDQVSAGQGRLPLTTHWGCTMPKTFTRSSIRCRRASNRTCGSFRRRPRSGRSTSI